MKNWIYYLVLVGCISAHALSANANAVIGDSLRMHVPWLVHENKLYALELDLRMGEGPLYFDVATFTQRNTVLPDGAENAAALLIDAETIRIPRVALQGAVYSLDLAIAQRNNKTVLNFISAKPATEPANRGGLVSATLIRELNTLQILALLPAGAALVYQPDFGVSIYKIVYQTADVFGNPTQATGVIGIPIGITGAFPLFSYQHGTEVLKSAVASADETADGFLMTAVMAAVGYISVAPDYLGMGDSPGLHPYIHAKSSATAVVDLLRAARSWISDQGLALNGQLFLGGYSEGGYVTMAATREIEMFHTREFSLTASAPMAGPYDLSGVMSDIVKNGDSVINAYYFPYTLLAANLVYGLADSYDELLRTPYDTTIPPLFDGTYSGSQINTALPAKPRDMLADNFLTQYGTNDTAPINLVLKENDLYRWVPQTAMNLYHCTGDDQVPFENSQVAYDYFKANDAPDVDLIGLPYGSHANCAIWALLEMKSWFDDMVEN